MLPVFATAKSLGSTLSILSNKWVLISVGMTAIIRKFKTLKTFHKTWGKVFSGLSTGSYIGAGLGFLTTALFLYNRHKLAVEENIKAFGRS